MLIQITCLGLIGYILATCWFSMFKMKIFAPSLHHAEKERMIEPLQVEKNNYAWTLASHLLASDGATSSCAGIGFSHAGFSQVYLSRMGSLSTAVRQAAAKELTFLQRVEFGLNEV